jgi:hypothetical protein
VYDRYKQEKEGVPVMFGVTCVGISRAMWEALPGNENAWKDILEQNEQCADTRSVFFFSFSLSLCPIVPLVSSLSLVYNLGGDLSLITGCSMSKTCRKYDSWVGEREGGRGPSFLLSFVFAYRP